MILFLEDHNGRVRRFAQALRKEAPDEPIPRWRSACRMADELAEYFSCVRLISLDHDLEPAPGDPANLGDGMVVTRVPVNHPQPCHVIIFSSNRTRSD